jgi:hypothetical protein
MSKATIVVGGALANKAGQGGEAWVRLNWVLGLKKLGYRILFLEQMPHAGREEIEYFKQVIDRFDLSGSAALIDEKGTLLAGHSAVDLAAGAQALINVSGHLRIEGKLKNIPRKVYVDLDPGFTQLWHAQGNRGARLEGHDFHFTVGENIGAPECSIPSVGIQWRKTKPPIVLEEWPVRKSESFAGFSTVANWRGPFGVIEFGGQTFGLKVHEFRKFIELPQRTGLSFEIALAIHPAEQKDLAALQRHGWRIVSPDVVARPDDFRSYVQSSSAEFSVAQGIYVQTQSGWFSDRTAAYLASGKPALIQDTGFSRHLPTGDGLLAFANLEQAVEGAEKIRSNYAYHCRAARALAEEYFDSDKVLQHLMSEISAAP